MIGVTVDAAFDLVSIINFQWYDVKFLKIIFLRKEEDEKSDVYWPPHLRIF